jgi:excisionase family DNA binding protein
MASTPLLTVAEAASELRLSKLSVYRFIADGRLDAVRIGENGKLRIPRNALDRLLVPARGRQ